MNRILRKMSPEVVNSANEKNLNELCILLAQKSHRNLVAEKDIDWVMTRPSVWPNHIFNARFRKTNAEDRIQQIKNKIEGNEAPPLWVIGPKSRPVELGRFLEKNGFRKLVRWPGMAVDLSGVNENHTKPTDLSVQPIQDIDHLNQWGEVVSKSMFGGKEFDIHLLRNLCFEPYAKIYLGLFHGKGVATSMLFLSSGVAGIYLVSVLPEYRNRGIGKTITLAPLSDALRMGYFIGVLQASDMGQKIYRKIGFQEYGGFDLYRYVP